MSRQLGILFKPDMHLAILEGRKTQTRRLMKPPPPAWVTEMGYTAFTPTGQMSGRGIYPGDNSIESGPAEKFFKPKYRVGDRLYVKEAHASPSKYIVAYKLGAECGAWVDDGNGGIFFFNHGLILESPDYSNACQKRQFVDTYGLAKYGGIPRGEYPYRYGWKSPLHMPKWAARTWLEVTEVRAERLQAISEEDAIAEGIFGPPMSQAGWRQYPYESCHLDTAKSSYRTLWESINGKGSWDLDPWVWVYSFKLCPKPTPQRGR